MKLKGLLFMALLLMVGSMVLTSCKDDDDKNDELIKSDIVGAWTTGITETGWTAKARVSHKARGPQKMESPKYYQQIFYYSPTGKELEIWAYYDSDENLVDADVYSGTYTVEGDKVKESFYTGDEVIDFKVEKDKLTYSWEESGETVYSTFKKLDTKDVEQFLNVPKEGIVGVWGLYDDNYKYYIDNNEYERIWKIYYANGKVDLLTLYYDDDQSTWKRSTVLHGTWTYKDYVLSENYKGKFKNDFLVNLSSQLYLTEYYIESDGSRKVFEYGLFKWEEDNIKDIYEMAEELN